ncbi:MAG TPA: sugar phosphate isomerase/epimerase [Daejeonella sp.]|nr:sugar phosphate isomerase/epimerase [Daejeonella sp.]
MSNRRTFIQQAGLLATGLAINPAVFLMKDKVVGLQLYSLREYIGKDVKGIIAKVAAAGYKDVETYGFDEKNQFFGLTPKAFLDLLKSNGLTTTSGHYNPNSFLYNKGTDELKYMIEASAATNQQHFVIPYLTEDMRQSADDYKKLAEKLNTAAELCKASNLKLAYHNHDFEFKEFDGVKAYDILLKETDKDLVDFELDLYWVVRSGNDPLELFAKHPGRFKLWHVKDMDKTNNKLNTEIGSGSIDYRKIFAKAKQSGVQHFFVEQENFKMDAFESITKSNKYVKNILLT